MNKNCKGVNKEVRGAVGRCYLIIELSRSLFLLDSEGTYYSGGRSPSSRYLVKSIFPSIGNSKGPEAGMCLVCADGAAQGGWKAKKRLY